MALKANYEFLFAGRDDNSFLENYSYDLFQDHGEKSGQIFVTLEIQNNPLDGEEIGKAIFEVMQNEFFVDLEADPYERFEQSLKEVNKVLDRFRAEKTSAYIGNLNVIIAAIVGEGLYLTQCGEAEAYLVRKRYVSIVSEGLDEETPDSGETFTNIASGNIEEGDAVLFSSTRLLRYIAKNDLAKFLSRRDVNKALLELKDAVSTEMLGRIGLTGMVFSHASELEIENIEEAVEGVNKSLLEATNHQIISQKESITGKFFTMLNKRKKSKTEVFQGSGGNLFAKVMEVAGRFLRALFSRGFGKDKILVLLVVVIVVLGVGIWVVKGNSVKQAELERLDGILVAVQDKVAEAETKSAYDKESAKIILDNAYNESMEVLNSGYYRNKAQTFLLQIEETRDNLDNVKRIEDPSVYIDLSAKRSDVNALGFVEVGDRIFAYEYNAFYEIVLDQVQDPLTIDADEQIIAATGFDDRNSIVFLTKSGKLIEYREGTVSFMDTDDGSFYKALSLDDWSNKVYMLDPVENQIWKYSYKGISDKFGAAESYLSGENDLSGAEDIAIDSSVYVLKDNGEIMRFYGGSNANLTIQNQPFGKMKSPSKIYTSEKMDNVYVVDSGQSRIYEYAKDSKSGNLVYKAQYLLDGLEVRDIYYDVNAKKLYVLTPSKVVEVGV